MRAMLALAALILLPSQTSAQNNPDNSRDWQILKFANVRSVSVEAFGNIPARCNVSNDDIRTHIVNRIIPAGLVVDKDNPLKISAEVIGLHLEYSDICVASLRTSVELFGLFTSLDAERDFSTLQIAGRTVIGSDSRPRFGNFFSEIVNREIDRILALWREANAGSDFVRQAAPPRPTQEPNIRTIQERLQALGLYTGAVDGRAGPQTRSAIQAFQRAQQLPATGDLDQETMRRMFP